MSCTGRKLQAESKRSFFVMNYHMLRLILWFGRRVLFFNVFKKNYRIYAGCQKPSVACYETSSSKPQEQPPTASPPSLLVKLRV